MTQIVSIPDLSQDNYNPRNSATWSPCVGSIGRHPVTPSTHTATVAEMPPFLAALHGVEAGRARKLVAEWLTKVELAAWADKKVEALSKGMQQKVQLIGTVLHEPELLILDEPFSGLDPLNQGLFRALINELKGRRKTIVFSTHVMEHAEKLCDTIALVPYWRQWNVPNLRNLLPGGDPATLWWPLR